MSHNVNVPTLTVAQAALLGVANLGRPNPNFGNITQYDALGDAWFNGLTLSLETRRAPWGGVRLSYTLSDAQDDAGNAFFQTPQTQNDILADKGPSDNDQRHRLVVSGTLGDGSSAALATGARRRADRVGLLVWHAAAVQRRHRRRQQQRHDGQRSAGRRRTQLRADAVLRRSDPDVRHRDVRHAGLARDLVLGAPTGSS